jgi:hypothetical protein
MRHARRLIAILIGCAAWSLVATTAAYAAMLHDPVPQDRVPGGSVVAPSNGTAAIPFWETAATAVLGFLLVLAITGLVFALRHSRRSQRAVRA